MKSISNVFATALLKGGFGDGKNADAPATFYLALSSTLPIVDTYGVMSNVTEPTTGGYVREAIANTSANWSVVNGYVSNINSVNFPTASANYDVVATYTVLFSAITGGIALWSASLGQPMNVYSGSILSLDPGTITFTAIEGI